MLPLHFKPSEKDVTLCIAPFLISIKNWASTKIFDVVLFWVFFFSECISGRLGVQRNLALAGFSGEM